MKQLIITLIIFCALITVGMNYKNSDGKSTKEVQKEAIDNSVILVADTLLKEKHLSKEKLRLDLLENFNAKTVEYALEEISIDYRQNALTKASWYSLDTNNFSEEQIRNKLTIDDLFTKEEVDYALEESYKR